jgi:hypothetical protein
MIEHTKARESMSNTRDGASEKSSRFFASWGSIMADRRALSITDCDIELFVGHL